MTASSLCHNSDNVVDLFSRKPYADRHQRRFVRLAPEIDDLEMLYSNDAHPDKLFTIKILCWALREDGEIEGMIPWLNQLACCTELNDPLNGQWEGYYDPAIDDVFFEPPIHKALELETAADYYDHMCSADSDIIQEIPDTIGTHAVLSDDGFKTLTLKEVVSWRLYHDGSLAGMIADEEKIVATPVLPRDPCLFAAPQDPNFRYYFQHHIANKIKARDPEALAAISMLVET